MLKQRTQEQGGQPGKILKADSRKKITIKTSTVFCKKAKRFFPKGTKLFNTLPTTLKKPL